MRKYEISPAVAAAIRNRMAASFTEVALPLYLDLPRYDELRAPALVEFDAEDARVEAESPTIGNEDDDDFY